MTFQQRLDARTLIETFWEFESGWGASPKALRAAVRLQRAVGYKTQWDKARLRTTRRQTQRQLHAQAIENCK